MSKIPRMCLVCLLVFVPTFLRAADFTVTSPNFWFAINGQEPNPEITLTRGQTYTFEVNTDVIHPFAISTTDFPFTPAAGVSNNEVSQGTVTFSVPLDAPDTLYYLCSQHFFGNIITIVDPPPPPAPNVKIISISLTSSNVTLKSLGTNGWTGIPEFSSNLLSSSWSVVPNYSNTFSNGTNTAIFNRLEAICGPNVYLRVRNTTNSP